MDRKQLEQLLASATVIARKAGEQHIKYFRHKGLHVDVKLNESDIVTAADKAAEETILREIHSLYPDHDVLSEESGETLVGSRYRWVIDPLDGTTNFSTGLPGFCVSIALEEDGESVLGVVYAPRLGELFTAVKGGGARLNGEPISVKSNRLIERAVVSTGFPVDKNVNPDNNIDNVMRVLPLVRGLRRLGSAALDLCYVGAGFLDAYWECNLHRWDIAAGLLIATEAGASHRFYRRDRNYSVLAATPAVFDQLVELIR